MGLSISLPIRPIVEESKSATVYVWSRKEVVRAWASDPSLTVYRESDGQVAPDYAAPNAVSYAYGAGTGTHAYETGRVLPEEQRVAVDLVERIARVRRVSVQVVDLAEERHFLQRRKAHENGWIKFPVLVSPNGSVLIGAEAFSEEAVTRLLTYGSSPLR